VFMRKVSYLSYQLNTEGWLLVLFALIYVNKLQQFELPYVTINVLTTSDHMATAGGQHLYRLCLYNQATYRKKLYVEPQRDRVALTTTHRVFCCQCVSKSGSVPPP